MNHEIVPFVDIPFQRPEPMLAPALLGLPEYIEFAYPEKMRKWWREVGGNKCQTHVYSERRGWHICGSTKDIEVDHLIEESVQLETGTDPNNSIGIPRCHEHHCGTGLITDDDGSLRIADYGESGWSRHPDMGQALISWRNGDKDSFKDAARRHHERAKKGLPVSNITPEIVEFEMEHMLRLEQEHIRKTKRQRPECNPHPKYRRRYLQ